MTAQELYRVEKAAALARGVDLTENTKHDWMLPYSARGIGKNAWVTPPRKGFPEDGERN